MTELQLYKWIQEHEPEWRWDVDSKTGKEDVIVWISVWSIESFTKLFEASVFNDGGGLDARITGRYIALMMDEVCGYFGIDIENVFPKP